MTAIFLFLVAVKQIEEELFVEIGVGETMVVSDPEGDFSVTALDANHCPGRYLSLCLRSPSVCWSARLSLLSSDFHPARLFFVFVFRECLLIQLGRLMGNINL